MTDGTGPQLPSAWRDIPTESIAGTVLITGGTDAGKSTLTGWLRRELRRRGRSVAVLDGDPGQSRLGPPTTMNCRLENGATRSWFVGSITPRGHMLPLLCGARRLVDDARDHGADPILYDTTGFVEPDAGGLYLKYAKVDLLQPTTVFVLGGGESIECLSAELRATGGVNLVRLPTARAASPRGSTRRKRYRRARFREYFRGATTRSFCWEDYGVRPRARFETNRLVALTEGTGWVRALGIVTERDPANKRVRLITPLDDLAGVEQLRIGACSLDPNAYVDERTLRG